MIINHTIKLETKEGVSFYDLTPKIKGLLIESKVKNGYILVFTKHTTSAIIINENEERLLEDFRLYLEKLAPKNAKYLHDDISLRDCQPNERLNGHSHLKALSLNSSEMIPIINGNIELGKWQAVLFIELDGGRNREIIVQLCGE
ncbi:YjbQ family protein [Candidatus Woesearchaeota archaeon]|nr:YjbQ family protein [Candidatus Woesearchaeota archaeon]